MDEISIGELSDRSGLAASAIRFYESVGLIESLRTTGKQRRFPRAVLRRLAFIRAAQTVGLSLDKIKSALARLPDNRTPTASDWETISAAWTTLLDEKIAVLARLRSSLTACIGCGCLSLKRCALYNPGDVARVNGAGARYLLGDDPNEFRERARTNAFNRHSHFQPFMPKPEQSITVVDYDSSWPLQFELLRSSLAEAVSELAISIEHVGSTAVPELAAKPIIDIDIVVDSSAVVPTIIKRLSPLGYVHQGNFGIADREAFASPVGTPAHHLYVCVQGAVALKNHLAIRDCLRNSAAAAAKYGLLKKELARRFPNNIDSYVDGKTDFLLELLREAGFAEGELAAISQANKMCPTNHAL
ncbi:MAG TPA: redox-sensitive transcriptional activator SoxR [Steroidobacteraceae bacterium]